MWDGDRVGDTGEPGGVGYGAGASRGAPFWFGFVGPHLLLAVLLTWRFGLVAGGCIAYGVALGVMGAAVWRKDGATDETTSGDVAGPQQVPSADA